MTLRAGNVAMPDGLMDIDTFRALLPRSGLKRLEVAQRVYGFIPKYAQRNHNGTWILYWSGYDSSLGYPAMQIYEDGGFTIAAKPNSEFQTALLRTWLTAYEKAT